MSEDIDYDFICNKCNIRVHITSSDVVYSVDNYIDDSNPGTIENVYLLTCDEQMIKNLLE